jgi:hypothetical protein
MLETTTDYIVTLALLELFEAAMQYAPTLEGVIARLYGYYRRSVFLFLGVHVSFIYILFVVLKTGVFNWTMLSIVALKIFDIFYKIEIIKARYGEKTTPPELESMLTMRLPWWFFLFGATLYPMLLYYALDF